MYMSHSSVHIRQSAKIASISLFLVIVTFVFYMVDLTDYGPTWDEFFHMPNGKRYLQFLQTGNLNEIFLDPVSSWLPPVSSTIGYVFVENSYLEKMYPSSSDRFHIGGILYGSITIGAVFLITYFLYKNIYIALFSSVLLTFLPQFITQSHTNVRDMGLTMFYAVTILTFMLATRRKGSAFWIILSGVCAALATDSKQNGFFLVPIGFIWFLLHLRTLGIKRCLMGYLLFLVVFGFGFFLFWPFLWADTTNHLRLAWEYLRSSSILGGNVTFYGQIYYSMKNIPFYYPWVMLFITTPPAVGLLALLGIVVSLKRSLGKNSSEGLLLLWIFIPLSRFLIPPSAIAHDQIRHFLEVLPAVPICAAIAVHTLYISSKNMRWKRAVIALAVFSVIYTRYISFRYQPYGTAYFNIFAGSPKYVSASFDVEYWGNVYRKAAEYLNMNYGKYALYYNPGLGTHLLRENGLQAEVTEDFYRPFQYVVFMNKQNWIRAESRRYIQWLLANKKPEFTIERGGVDIFYQFKPYKEEYILANQY